MNEVGSAYSEFGEGGADDDVGGGVAELQGAATDGEDEAEHSARGGVARDTTPLAAGLGDAPSDELLLRVGEAALEGQEGITVVDKAWRWRWRWPANPTLPI